MKRISALVACACMVALVAGWAGAEEKIEAKPVAPAEGLTPAPKLPPGQAWVHVFGNFGVDPKSKELEDLVVRMAKCGYNGIEVADVKFEKIQLMDDKFKARLQHFRQVCKDNKVQLAVSVAPFGYDDMWLSHDPNLSEGYPTHASTFVVKDGKLVPFDDTVALVNGELVEKGGKVAGWDVDDLGKKAVAEPNGWNGKPCICITDPEGRCRMSQKVKVHPNTYYILSALVKAEGWTGKDCRMMAMGKPSEMPLNNGQSFAVDKKMTDWKRVGGSFCSNENGEVTIFIGTWEGKAGKMWIADVKLEPGGFTNIVRRDGAPLSVMALNDGKVFEEGKDFSKVADPKLVNDPNPGYFTVYHEPPVVTIPAGSRLKEGDKVVASFCFASESGKPGQMNVCLAEPKNFDLIREQVKWMKDNVGPDVYFMGFDEMRFSGWDDSCVKSGKTPGQLLGEAAAKTIRIIKEVDPGKPIATWNDMFDPYHNAAPEIKQKWYYLVKGKGPNVGPWAGAWDGISSDVVIFNWRQNKMEGVKFFADRGNQQILAGYYDKDPKRIVEWLTMAKGTPEIIGVMYTTWMNKYTDLEEYIKCYKDFEAGK